MSTIAILGIALILITLLVLMGKMNKLFALLAPQHEQAATGDVLPNKTGMAAQGVPPEVVAAIAGAIAAMEGETPFSIRSITQMPVRKGRGAWGYAGVSAVTEPF